MFFLKKWFGSAISLLIGSIIAASPYFIFTSIFVGNNIFVLPLLVFFIICNYYIFIANRDLKKFIWFLAGLSVSFIFEFEVAFGLFLIPSYFLILLLKKQTRRILFRRKRFVFFLSGFIIPFIPRLLFEIKNGFFQIKTIFSYFLQPKISSPKSLIDVLVSRSNLFWRYFKGLFANDLTFYSFLLGLIISGLVVLYKRKKNNYKSINFFSSLILLLFIFSLFYKDNFWANYYEGIQYLFLVLAANIFFLALNKKRGLLVLLIMVLFINLATSMNSVIKDFNKKPEQKLLNNQIAIVTYISNKVQLPKESEYCVKVYTPPVIPFTYRYLFLYKNISKKISYPKEEWVNRKCWYIIETDDNKERRAEWIDKNIPRVADMVEKKLFNDVEILLYELN